MRCYTAFLALMVQEEFDKLHGAVVPTDEATITGPRDVVRTDPHGIHSKDAAHACAWDSTTFMENVEIQIRTLESHQIKCGTGAVPPSPGSGNHLLREDR